jgi:acetyl esterase/lipase
VHGGFWRTEYDRAHLRPMASALAALGHPTVLLEYSRVPGDPDTGVADLRAALAALPGLLGRPPVLVGHSAGGQLALLSATWPDTAVRGCLALSPVADLELADHLDLDAGAVRAYLGHPAKDRPDLDPARLPAPRVPVTVLHGESDDLVPIAVSEAYCAATGTPLRRLPGTGHFALIDPTSAAWSVVLAELRALGDGGGIE